MGLLTRNIISARICNVFAAWETMFFEINGTITGILNPLNLIIGWFTMLPCIYKMGAIISGPIAFLFCFFFTSKNYNGSYNNGNGKFFHSD